MNNTNAFFDCKTAVSEEHTCYGRPAEPKSILPTMIFTFGIPLSIALHQADRLLSMVTISLVLIAGGIAILATSARRRRDKKLLPFALITIGAERLLSEIAMILLANSGSYTADELERISGILSFIFTMTIGLSMVILPFIADKIKKDRCSLLVEAVCMGGVPSPMRNAMVELPVWEYTVYGAVYRNGNAPWAAVGNPQPGDIKDILVDPNNPYDVYTKDMVTMLMSALFGAAIVVLTFYFNFA